MEENQRSIIRSQDDQKSALAAVQQAVIDDIIKKIEDTNQQVGAVMPHTQGNGQGNKHSYAHKAALPAVQNGTQTTPQPIPKYVAITKRTSSTRTPTSQTNGGLAIVYVKDSRSEPVGIAKKTLRQDIAEWLQQKEGEEGAMVIEETWPDLDAVRHVNQFGTPDEPMMEICCTSEKVDSVRAFLPDNDIETWPSDTKPLRIPSIQTTDTSPAAVKKGVGHLTRVILSWWKAANFVQSTDKALYYQRLIMQKVQDPDALHQWPSYITGINIDARG